MMDRENESWVGVSGTHNLYGRHAHIWLKISLLWNQRAHDIVTCNVALGHGCAGLEIQNGRFHSLVMLYHPVLESSVTVNFLFS